MSLLNNIILSKLYWWTFYLHNQPLI